MAKYQLRLMVAIPNTSTRYKVLYTGEFTTDLPEDDVMDLANDLVKGHDDEPE